ncbi:hypothetical protein [Streptomyces sp. bgisy031]|uniref:hypothetical protein n=1 Tax=Streptomyces sp. bgisy031 TaxID=3413772 RepID=UPI003D70780C
MTTMDAPSDEPVPRARAAPPAAAPALKRVPPTLMTTSSVAGPRAAPSLAAYGLACVFVYIVPTIVFALPPAPVPADPSEIEHIGAGEGAVPARVRHRGAALTHIPGRPT